MPLRRGKTRADMAYNVRELKATGRPAKQAVAIAYNVARKGRKKK